MQSGSANPGIGGWDGTSPNPVGNGFMATFVNRMNAAITFNIGNQSQVINTGQSLQVNASEGQEYGYSGSPREVAPGQWVGGGVYRGQFSSNQQTITIGDQSNPTPGPTPNPNNMFSVTFVNNYNASVDILIMDENQNQVSKSTIPAGQRIEVNAKQGYTYIQQGPVVYNNGGAISGTSQGQISAANPTIQLQN